MQNDLYQNAERESNPVLALRIQCNYTSEKSASAYIK